MFVYMSQIRWLCPVGEHMGTWDSKVWFLLPRLAERCGNGRGMSPTRRAKPADRAFRLTCEFCLQHPVVTYQIMSRWASQTCCKVSPGPGTHDTFAAASSVCGVPELFDLVPVRLWRRTVESLSSTVVILDLHFAPKFFPCDAEDRLHGPAPYPVEGRIREPFA